MEVGLAVVAGWVATGYLGMFLLGLGFSAMGLLASALTESQMVAVNRQMMRNLLPDLIFPPPSNPNDVEKQIQSKARSGKKF